MHKGILIVSKQTLVVIFKKKNSMFWRLVSSLRHDWLITVLLNAFILLLFVFPQVPLFTTGHVAVNVIVFLDTKYCNNCLCSLRFCKFLWCSERLSMWMFQQGRGSGYFVGSGFILYIKIQFSPKLNFYLYFHWLKL